MRLIIEPRNPRDHATRVQQLERRYRRVQNALTSATASHEALRELPASSERQLERARLQVQTLQRQLAQVLESLERAEELEESDALA
ncbi:MAG TPA: hypothetical protein VMT83_11445 [Burkholderiaceae bacterium]|nr:hypothetical protein [Burkholderiaceae bacterium]